MSCGGSIKIHTSYAAYRLDWYSYGDTQSGVVAGLPDCRFTIYGCIGGILIGKLFFIADLHFGYKNCLSYDARPFKDTEENDAEIVRRWNNAVGIDDDVWILGDVGWYSVTKLTDILKSLNGLKHLCIGNHDHKYLKNPDFRAQFVEITHYKEIDFGYGSGVVLSHYPIPCFNNHYQGWYHLYGHVHSSFEWHMMERIKYEMTMLYEKPCNMWNVGAMMPYMDYTPRTLNEIIGQGVVNYGSSG